MKKLTILFLAFLMTPVFAITIGGIYFDDLGFVDGIGAYGGTWSGTMSTLIGTGNLANTASAGSVNTSDMNAYADLLFTNNVVYNGVGNDLAIFEWSGNTTPGTAGCLVRLQINGVTNIYTPYWIEGGTNVAYINLDDFGVALGSYLTSVRILGYTDPEYVAVTALHIAIPEPSTLVLFGMICLGLITLRKKL